MRPLFRFSLLSTLLAPIFAAAFTPINLVSGWNLVGNGDPEPIDVASKLSGTQITTVWKWNKAAGKWAFYAPSMSAQQLSDYALSKGYDVLASIESKEGFWVNANAAVALTDPLAPPPAVGSNAYLSEADLSLGWNLLGSADNKNPSALNSDLFNGLNAAGKALSTVWAWDAVSTRWRFYAPSLEAQGGSVLADYINTKGYYPFTSVLASTDGFWVNVGATTPIPATARLRLLNFTSVNDWFMRVTSSSAAQSVPRIDGSTRYREMRTARVAGSQPYSWVRSGSPDRATDMHWTGSTWAVCPLNHENILGVPNANNLTLYNYCNNREVGTDLGESHNKVDISNQPMIDFYNKIQTDGYTNLFIASAATALGSATFPVGSGVDYKTIGADYTIAISYATGTNNWVYLSDAAVGAGDATACNANPFPAESPNATLDQLVSTNKGIPCVYGEATITGLNGVQLSSGTRNEGWGSTTLSMGKIGNAPTYLPSTSVSSYYTTNTRLRVAFGTGNVAKYYSCQERWNGSTRNCDLIGTGTYSIQTLGDARAMTFSGAPAPISTLTYDTVFVERGGHVFYGYQSKAIQSDHPQARLNLTALNALFSTLGLPAFDAAKPIVLTQGSYSASYNGGYSGTQSGSIGFVINPNGTNTCSGYAANAQFACTVSLTPLATDSTQADVRLVASDKTFFGVLNYYTGVINGTWSGSAGSGTFNNLRN